MGGTLSLTRYQELLPSWNKLLALIGAKTPSEIAMVAAQIGTETAGMRYQSEIASGDTGSAGSLGEPSLKDEHTSATGISIVPSAFGITAPQIGRGGAGGAGGSGGKVGSSGSTGSKSSTGGSGGLTVIYQWPKPG